jgi:hypothetical protein
MKKRSRKRKGRGGKSGNQRTNLNKMQNDEN